MRAFFRISLLLLVLLIVLSSIAVYWTFYRSVPDYDSSFRISGIEQEVDIYRDNNAIPHIHAQTESDLYFAAGYVHAQDRIWQMTLYQLMAQGRFSEFLGEELIDTDRFLRTIGFYRTAVENFDLLSDVEQELLYAYSRGVNAWVVANKRNLPVEFSLTGIDPIPWTPAHSLALVRLMAWELNQSWWTKSMIHILGTKLDRDTYSLLLPKFHESYNPHLSDNQSSALESFLKAELDIREKLEFQGWGAGSNAWAVDGALSKNGFTMLAGDPHLGLAMPARWYEIHYSLNGKNTSGATLAGVPLIVLGHTDFAAWSLTNVMLDDTDFYIIAQDPEDRGRYVIDSTSAPMSYKSFERVREIIHVKDNDDILHEVLVTDFGPVINNIHEHQDFYDGSMLAMKWTGHLNSNEFRVFRGLMWAETFQEVQDVLPYFSSPAQNLIYADRDGNIAHFALGKVPIRNNPLNIRRSWIPNDRWRGFVPFESMPKEINPERGWVGNANQKLVSDSYPHYLSAFWHPDTRMNRIADLLESEQPHSIASFKQMQNDIYSDFARYLTEQFLDAVISVDIENDSQLAIAIPYLTNWNHTYGRTETAASIIELTLFNLTEKVISKHIEDDELRNAYTALTFPVTNRMYHAIMNHNDRLIPAASRDSLIQESMRQAISYLEKIYEDKTYNWRWENLHSLHLKSPIFAEAAEADDSRTVRLIHNSILARGPYPVGGSNTTVNMGSYEYSSPFDMVLGPSIRRIVDFSNPSVTISSMPGGQSGNPLSRYYDNQLPLWLQGDYKELHLDHRNLNQYKKYHTRLRPQ